MTTPKSTCPLEREEQAAFVKWFKQTYPDKKIIHIPNELAYIPNGADKKKGKFIGYLKKRKLEGVEKGASDLFIPEITEGRYRINHYYPAFINYGLWLEMKRVKNYKVSLAQVKFLIDMERNGYAVGLPFGCEQGKQITNDYFNCGYHMHNGAFYYPNGKLIDINKLK
jgi:hypothetical protein